MGVYSVSMRNSSPFGSLLIIAFIIVFAVIMGSLSQHAIAKHNESQAIHNCINNNGPYMQMKNMFDDVYYLICQFSTDKWGFEAVTKDGKVKTAFSPDSGSFQDLMKYLNRIANKYTKPLPWLSK